MATLRTIRLRIKGTKNIKQITRAMEAVSAVKMRKSQSVALAARPYAISALSLLHNLKRSVSTANVHPFLRTDAEQTRKGERGTDAEKRMMLVVVTSDKGLAGPFNTNVLKKAEQFVKNTTTPSPALPQSGGHPSATEEGKKITLVTVGKKAGEYFSRRGRKPIVALTGYGDYGELAEVEPLFEAVSEAFVSGKADEVFVIYTNFLSAMKQEVVVRKLLPFSEEGLEEMVRGIVPERGRFAIKDTNIPMGTNETNNTNKSREYLFEPSPKEILEAILPALLKVQIYHAILEANASEHSSRMVAMRSATDNAGELIKSYTVSLNKARQAAINKELAEITGGSEALSA